MAKKTAERTVSAESVLGIVQQKLFNDKAFAMLREVRSRTGFGNGRERYADALVVSLWPSRGIWIGGLEVKVSRSDWKSELEKPEKSLEIQRFCSYWWLATPPGIVKPGELPELWGHVEVGGTRCTVVKDAPKLEPEPLSPMFVASLLRNAAAKQSAMRDRAYESGFIAARERFAADGTDVEALKR